MTKPKFNYDEISDTLLISAFTPTIIETIPITFLKPLPLPAA